MVRDSFFVVKRTHREFARDSGAKEEREIGREKGIAEPGGGGEGGKGPQRIIEGRKKDEKSFTPMCSSRGAVAMSPQRWG